MEFRDHLRESQTFLSRTIVAGIIVIIMLGVVVSRMMQLQIIDHDHFQTLSQDNRVKVVPLPPTRGLIYDSNGVLLAQNRPAYNLEITPEGVDDLDQTLAELSKVISISQEDLERFKKLKRRKRRFDSIPIRINLSIKETAEFAVHRHRFPGVDIKAHLSRHYPQKNQTAHVLGYVGRISQKDLEVIDASEYAGTSHIGKIGIEKTYESALHGKVGLEQVEVNARGRVVNKLEQAPPVPGFDIHLHLDTKLQDIAMQSFGEESGALVAIDPNNGGVLALVSNPGFNPNLFVEGISSKNYKALQKDPNKPLYNRALRGQYPPGSTVKPFVALAGLETKTIDYESTTFCRGYYQLPGHEHKYRDWKKTGHGVMDMTASVTQSCDVFFYKLAHDLGIDKMHEYMQPFGFGDKTGIDLVGEAKGLLPSREWKRQARRQPWYPGETLIVGIGQGYFLTTPLQLASATAALANGGIFYPPRIVDYLQQHGQDKKDHIASEGKSIEILKEQNWTDVKDSMLNVVEGARGTARRIKNEHYTIAGKTGTAQVFTVAQDEEYDEETVEKRKRDHALFVAYAPADNPEIAIAVIVENGGHGGSVAAPIAKAVMDAYLLKKEAKP